MKVKLTKTKYFLSQYWFLRVKFDYKEIFNTYIGKTINFCSIQSKDNKKANLKNLTILIFQSIQWSAIDLSLSRLLIKQNKISRHSRNLRKQRADSKYIYIPKIEYSFIKRTNYFAFPWSNKPFIISFIIHSHK